MRKLVLHDDLRDNSGKLYARFLSQSPVENIQQGSLLRQFTLNRGELFGRKVGVILNLHQYFCLRALDLLHELDSVVERVEEGESIEARHRRFVFNPHAMLNQMLPDLLQPFDLESRMAF